jgi:hypothetical protein
MPDTRARAQHHLVDAVVHACNDATLVQFST